MCLYNKGQVPFLLLAYIGHYTAILLQNTGQQPFSFLSPVNIQPYCCKIRDSYPFSFSSLVTIQWRNIAEIYGTANLFPFRLWSLYNAAILLQNTGHLPFFLFISGHYTMQPYCCKIRDSYPFSFSSLWSLYNTAILLQNTGQLPFFHFISGHFTATLLWNTGQLQFLLLIYWDQYFFL